MNFVNKLSQAIRSKTKSHRGLSTHLAIALIFSLIAIGYMGYTASQTLAQTIYELSFRLASSDYIIDTIQGNTYLIDVNLTPAYSRKVTVDYVINEAGNDTAIEGTDYILATKDNTITFSTGETVQQIPIIILATATEDSFFTLSLDVSTINPITLDLVLAQPPFDEHIGTLVLPDTDPIVNLQFTQPISGDQFTLGDTINISLVGDYNQYVMPPFTVEFSVCFNNPGMCLTEKLIPDAIINPDIAGLFSIDTQWLNAGYLLDGVTKISEDMTGNNVYISANIAVHSTSAISGSFSINDITPTVTINVINPDASHPTWAIGSTESIQWLIVIDGTGGDPGISQYNIDYAVDGTTNWQSIVAGQASISGNLLYSYDWVIPEISPNLLGNDFKIKISVLDKDTVLIAEGISELFSIDYGNVTSFDIEAPLKIATDLVFDVTITAIDQYGNVISNFNSPDIVLNYTVGSDIAIISQTQGLLSAWNNGLATLSNNIVIFTLTERINISSGSVVITNPPDLAEGTANVDFVRDLIAIDIPNDSTVWNVGDTKDIIFRVGGETPIDHIEIYYSEGTGLPEDAWILINDDVVLASPQPQAYPWNIPTVNLPNTQGFIIKVESYDGIDDFNLITVGFSEFFTINSSPVLFGTYISKEFTIVDFLLEEELQSLDGFNAIADKTVNGINSKLEFYIRFIKSDETYLGSATDGWIVVSYPNDGLDFIGLDLSLVEKVQFKIYMETMDPSLYNPWIQSLSLDYTIQTPDPTSEFNLSLADDSPRTTMQGGTLIFDIIIHRNQEPPFVEGIEFSSTILTDTYVWDKIADQDPANSFFSNPPPVTKPDGIITLQIKILDMVDTKYLNQKFSFTITGISTGSQSIERSVTGYITVSSGDIADFPAITINATVPLELGLFMDDLTKPEFILRLYESTVTDPADIDYEIGGLIANGYDSDTETATLQINIDEGNVANNITYSSYIRTNRHLWDKATTDFTVDADNPTYTVEFPKLVIGDISLDNIINTFDFNLVIGEFGKDLLVFLADFNFDGVVNVQDLGLLFPNWFIDGNLPSSED